MGGPVRLADEPTTALDVTIQAQVLEIISELQRKFDMSMILITHDLGVVAETCDKVAIMYAGQIVLEVEPNHFVACFRHEEIRNGGIHY